LPAEAMDAYRVIRRHRVEGPDADILAALDRYRVDFLLGVGVPGVQSANRPRIYTTAHLEHAPGWRLVFRDLRSSVSMRDDPRNEQNLDRIVAYYARERVPFDPERGFDVDRVLREAPAWAVQHGLAPAGFAALANARF